MFYDHCVLLFVQKDQIYLYCISARSGMYANIYLPYGKRTESGGEVSWQLLREMYHNLYINIILKASTSEEKNTTSDYSDIFTFWRF